MDEAYRWGDFRSMHRIYCRMEYVEVHGKDIICIIRVDRSANVEAKQELSEPITEVKVPSGWNKYRTIAKPE